MSTPAAFTELTTRRIGPIRAFFARHPRVMDALVIAIFLVPGLLSAVSSPDQELLQAVAMLATYIIAGALLWWRRQYPARVLALILLVTAISSVSIRLGPGTEFAVAFALYCVATTQKLRHVWLWWLGSSLVIIGSYLVSDFGTEQVDSSLEIVNEHGEVITGLPAILAITGLTIGITLIAVLIGLNVRARRQHIQTLIDRGNQLALERDQRALLAVTGERQRIARELHDVVAHSLSVMITLTEGAAVMVDRDLARAREALEQTATTGRDALADMRTVLGVLRETDDLELEPQPGGNLSELIAQFQRAGLPVQLQLESGSIPHEPALRLQLYRIVQESLTNILRHAPHSPRILVEIHQVDSALEIVVENELPGNLAQQQISGSGRGLVGMRERVAALNGTMSAGRHHNVWRIHAHIPLVTPPADVNQEGHHDRS